MGLDFTITLLRYKKITILLVDWNSSSRQIEVSKSCFSTFIVMISHRLIILVDSSKWRHLTLLQLPCLCLKSRGV